MVYLFTEKQLLNILSSRQRSLYSKRHHHKQSDRRQQINMHNLVWKLLEKELTGIRTIYFAPAGELHRIAFAALPITKKEVLSDRYNLIQLTSTASVPDLTPTFIRSPDNLQLYGGIKYDTGTFKYLPGTEAEIDSIKMLATTRQIRRQLYQEPRPPKNHSKPSTERPPFRHPYRHPWSSSFRTQKPNQPTTSNQPTIEMVWSSHNPMTRYSDPTVVGGANLAWAGHPTSGIDDGILNGLRSLQHVFANQNSWFSPAHETALGDIRGSEGVYGLQRAFKIAGVPNLIMSLWKVPDAETVEFMQEFYKNLFAGKSISTAFYQAQNTLKAKYRTDPYKWAAWVLVR